MSEPAKKDLPDPWQTMTPEQFRDDPVAVLEYRAFLATDTGKKFLAVIRGANPLLALVTPEAGSPAVIRSASALEAQGAESTLGKATGYQALATMLTDRLTKPKADSKPKSRRGGREIAPAPAPMPT